MSLRGRLEAGGSSCFLGTLPLSGESTSPGVHVIVSVNYKQEHLVPL